jgi:hypothetical protein
MPEEGNVLSEEKDREMIEKKGLESVHRWKKEYKATVKYINDITKKIESLKEKSTYEEIRVYERKLSTAQEKLSLLEKQMVESWIPSNGV